LRTDFYDPLADLLAGDEDAFDVSNHAP
jgi:hypothetical protein